MLLLWLAFHATAGDAPTNSINSAKLEVRPLGQDRFALGSIEFSKAAGQVSFPAEVNLDNVPMEYFIVTDLGKRHESVLRTRVEPTQIHTAMLLAGFSPGNAVKAPSTAVIEAAKGQLQKPSRERLPGRNIQIEVAWRKDGMRVTRKAEEMIENAETHKPPQKPEWIYNGSLLSQNKFLAQETGSIVSLVTDPAALVNNESEGHDNDKIWIANTNTVPAVGTPVTVTLRLLPSK